MPPPGAPLLPGCWAVWDEAEIENSPAGVVNAYRGQGELTAKPDQLNQEYKRFSKATGLRLQHERMEMSGFGPKQVREAERFSESMLLPKRDSAAIPIQKFTGYALNPDKQPDKAVAFSLALGYNMSNADDLVCNIHDNLSNFPVLSKGDDGYGMRYEVSMNHWGPNGKRAKVITAWIDDAKTKEMRLVSAYVDKRRGKR